MDDLGIRSDSLDAKAVADLKAGIFEQKERYLCSKISLQIRQLLLVMMQDSVMRRKGGRAGEIVTSVVHATPDGSL
jgi:hypothetical protein